MGLSLISYFLFIHFLVSPASYVHCFRSIGYHRQTLSRSKNTQMSLAKSIGKLIPARSALLVCDMQERFRPLIHRNESIIQTCKLMTSVSKELDIPIVVTEQYPKVFGPTIKECFADQSHLDSLTKYPKKLFSMMTPEVSDYVKTLDVDTFILLGIEAHVCVQQTALDLLERGHEVHIIADGISSQQSYDREIALQRMVNSGAYLTTAQSAVFMLMQSADHPNFKAVSKLVVDHMKLPNEFNIDK